MNKTENLKLNVWEKSDPILVGDFNEDNRKIDAEIHQTQIMVQDCAKVKFGQYLGDGAAKREILLESTPKVVAIWSNNGAQYDSYSKFVTGGICGTDAPCQYSYTTAFEIMENGFRVYENAAAWVNCNYSGTKYYYLAIF